MTILAVTSQANIPATIPATVAVETAAVGAVTESCANSAPNGFPVTIPFFIKQWDNLRQANAACCAMRNGLKIIDADRGSYSFTFYFETEEDAKLFKVIFK